VTWKPDYATSTELAAYVRVDDDIDATEMAAAVTNASRAVDNYCKRQFGVLSAAAARYYTAWWDREAGSVASRASCAVGRWVVEIDDLMTTTDLTVALDDGTGDFATEVVTSTYYALRPVNAAADGEPWTQLHFLGTSVYQPTGAEAEVKATAIWGWTSVPSPVKTATLMQASRFLSRRDSPYGIAGSPPRRDSGSGMSVAAEELKLMFYELDPDIAASLRSYRRDWWFA
jgi:hypothetical protein